MSAGAFSSVTSSSVIWIVEPEPGDVGEKPAQPLRRKRRPADRSQMRLDADRVDRRPRPLHPLEQIEQHAAAGFLLGGVELDIVFVDDEPGLGIGFARGAIGEVEIAGPERLEKDRLA